VRAADFGLPLAIAIIGGIPERFSPLVDLYRRALVEANQPALPVGINSHGFIADTMQQAIDIAYPAHEIVMNNIGKERGWPPITKADFEASAQLQGAMFLGSPEQIAEKIVYQHGFFHHQRFLLQLSVGTIAHADVMKAIELYGTKVAPLVRQELAGSPSPAD
jgi:alkanesulfonate monooxygenase SsuD/methylene tetrahydromethanopterin reductase-like flavin-dependent oxidoreductase (luciferase family)